MLSFDYDFDRHLAEMRRWESEKGKMTSQLSGWENSPDEVSIPWGFLNDTWNKSLRNVNKYIEDEHAEKFLDGELFLNGKFIGLILPNSTAALNIAIISAVKTWGIKSVGIVQPAYFTVGRICSSLGLRQINTNVDHWINGTLSIADAHSAMSQLHDADMIIITAPMYGSGLDISEFTRELIAIGINTRKSILVDAAFDGLLFRNNSCTDNPFFRRHTNFHNKIMYIHSPAKSLFLNGAKSAVLTGDNDVIANANELRNVKAGTVTAFQAELVLALSSSRLPHDVAASLAHNAIKIRRNYEALSVLSMSRGWSIANSSVGIHTVVFDKIDSFPPGKVTDHCIKLLKSTGVFALPLEGLGYRQNVAMGYRVNLAANWPSISSAFLRLAEFHSNGRDILQGS
jgi:aspartate/methionine/tyrosine aminotransferase